MSNKMDFLRLVFVIIQVPIIAGIVVLCYRATRVLKFKPLWFVLLGFAFNFIYILLNVFTSKVFSTTLFSNLISYPDLSIYTEICDLLSFSMFIFAFFISTPKIKISILLSTVVIIWLILWALHPSNIYLAVSSFYKAGAIFLLILLFSSKFFKFESGRLWVLTGLIIWLLLQFPNFLFNERAVKYEYIFFLLATFGKIFIAVSLFQEPILYEIFTSSEKKEKEFEKILETTFHEIYLPMTAMELNLSSLAKGDNSKGQKYQELESDFEMINAVIQNGLDAFKKSNDDENSSQEISNDAVLNLNKIIQKCTVTLKHEFSNSGVNFKIKFGRNVHALGHAGQVTQILNNILKNAIEAYSIDQENKNVIIQTGFINTKPPEKIAIPFVIITDFAKGIRKKDIENIWERGFSTKEDKPIKGQGLFIAKELAFKNSIDIELVSNHIDETSYAKKVGSTFKLYFKNA